MQGKVKFNPISDINISSTNQFSTWFSVSKKNELVLFSAVVDQLGEKVSMSVWTSGKELVLGSMSFVLKFHI